MVNQNDFLAIFDLDGTLLDTLDDLADTVNSILSDNGFLTHERDMYRQFVGNGALKLLERAVPGLDGKDYQRLRSDFDRVYRQRCRQKTKPYSGITETLKHLKDFEWRLAVLSNKPDTFVKELVTDFFGDSIFDLVLGQRDHIRPKPAPDGLLEIINTLACKPQNTIMIGDSNVDIETAVAARIDSVGCLWGFRGREELEKSGATRLASCPMNLIELLQERRMLLWSCPIRA